MERGTELSQTVATFIIQKILLDKNGLEYICMTPDRFFAVITVLNTIVERQLQKPSTRLLKHVIKCYARLSENPRAAMAFVSTQPTIVKEFQENGNSKLNSNLEEQSKKILQGLIDNIYSQQESARVNQSREVENQIAERELELQPKTLRNQTGNTPVANMQSFATQNPIKA